MTLTLAEAQQIIEAALDHARERSARVSVCICDENGRFIALNRMDGAVVTANRQAIGKALASASTGQPSGYMPASGEAFGSIATVKGEGMPLSHRQGGLPIYRNGPLVGACDVGGAEADPLAETCASAGIGAVAGLRPAP